MRKIKFRAWDTVRQKWITDYVIDPDGFVMSSSNSNFYYEGLHETKIILLQFTGLKDKNGKEIYEGDILSHPSTNKRMEVKHGLIGWIFSSGTVTTSYSIEFKIIGNIYENMLK